MNNALPIQIRELDWYSLRTPIESFVYRGIRFTMQYRYASIFDVDGTNNGRVTWGRGEFYFNMPDLRLPGPKPAQHLNDTELEKWQELTEEFSDPNTIKGFLEDEALLLIVRMLDHFLDSHPLKLA